MISKKNLSSLIRYEYLILVLAVLSLLISCAIYSEKKVFWHDELFSYYLISDQYFTSMLAAFHDMINNTNILYFLLGWFWAKILGSTELSLRLFSSLGICVALVITWITLRQTYNSLSALFGVLTVFCLSGLILELNAEAQMYGFFLACCSLGFFQYNALNQYPIYRDSTYKRNLFLNILIHIAIVNSHLFGIFFSGAILASHLLTDIYFKRLRPFIYFSILLSWTSLVFYIFSFLIEADMGCPRSWIPIPKFRELISVLNPSLSLDFPGFNLLIFVLLIAGLQVVLSKNAVSSSTRGYKKHGSEFALLVFAYSFLAVPILVWIISKTIGPIFFYGYMIPIFFDRDMIPTELSWSILLTFLFSRIILPFTWEGFSVFFKGFLSLARILNKNILALILLSLLLIHPIKYASQYSHRVLPGLNDGKYGYLELPVVVQAPYAFIKRFFYSPQRDRYFYILDWDSAIDKNSGGSSTEEYKRMQALERNYPQIFINQIIQSERFLESNNQFLVLDFLEYSKKCKLDRTWENIECPQWLERRILNNNNYEVKNLGQIDGDKVMLLVKQKSVGSGKRKTGYLR